MQNASKNWQTQLQQKHNVFIEFCSCGQGTREKFTATMFLTRKFFTKRRRIWGIYTCRITSTSASVRRTRKQNASTCGYIIHIDKSCRQKAFSPMHRTSVCVRVVEGIGNGLFVTRCVNASRKRAPVRLFSRFA